MGIIAIVAIPLSNSAILGGVVEGFDLAPQTLARIACLDAATPRCTLQLSLCDGSAGEVQLVQRGVGRDHEGEDRGDGSQERRRARS